MKGLIWSQFVQVYVHLQHPTFQPHKLKIFCFMFAGTSTVAKPAFCVIGTLMGSPTRRLFVVFISFDSIGIALFYWWLVRYTVPGLQLRSKVKRLAWFLSSIASLSCLITAMAFVFNCWLLPVGVSSSDLHSFPPTLIGSVTICFDQCLKFVKFVFPICSASIS